MLPKCFKKETKPSLFCPGCGHSIILKYLGFVLDELKIAQKTLLGLDIGCSLLAWDYFNVDTIQTHHGRTVPLISGFKFAKPEVIAIAYQGDGGAYAIGLQSLLHSAHRNDKITVIVINNTLYAMTGGQMAPTTLPSEITTTTPLGRDTKKTGLPFLGPEILIPLTSGGAYIARATVSNQIQLKDYLKRALLNQIEGRGFSFLEVLSICPVNWKLPAKGCLEFLKKMERYYRIGELKIG